MNRVAVTLLAAFALVSCGSSTQSLPPADTQAVVAGALRNTTAAQTARVKTEAKSLNGPKPMKTTVDGEVDFGSGRAHLRGTLGQDDEQELIVDGDRTYLRGSGIGSEQRPWVVKDRSLPRPTTASTIPFPAEFVPQLLLQPTDPALALGSLEGVTSSAYMGTDTVRGARTRHYRVQVDLAVAARHATVAAGAKASASLATLVEEFGRLTGSTQVPAELWIDQDGKLRRLRYSHGLPNAATASGSVYEYQADYFDFGAKIRIDPPAPDQVQPLS